MVIDNMQEVCGLYSSKELLSIVARLSEKFTSKESTSITYERAQMLLEAVLYCIQVYEDKCMQGAVPAQSEVSATQAYNIGYQLVCDKIKQTQEKYNEHIPTFCFYGNKNYQDTVQKAIPGFFMYYDPLFAPNDNIITMDYPVLVSMQEFCGINAIEVYVECICMEQLFLGHIPKEYVVKVLSAFHTDYQEQFFNICSIVLRSILSNMVIGRKIGEIAVQEDYNRLERMVTGKNQVALFSMLKTALIGLLDSQYKGEQKLLCYLENDLHNFATDLYYGAKNGCIDKIVKL